MEEKKIYCKKKYQEFQRKHPVFFRQAIVRSFLQENTNYELVQQALCSPNEKNRKKVDEAFRKFYGNIRILTYLSNLIYYNTINFDKKMKKHYNRERLTLDQPLQNKDGNEKLSLGDMLYYSEPDITDSIIYQTMADYVGDVQLYQAIKVLTSKQQEILTYKYVYGLQNKEIADLLKSSPQNISKLHQTALQKLKKHLKQEVQ